MQTIGNLTRTSETVAAVAARSAHDRWPGRGIHATPVAVTGGTITPDINATLTTG